MIQWMSQCGHYLVQGVRHSYWIIRNCEGVQQGNPSGMHQSFVVNVNEVGLYVIHYTSK